MRLWERQTLHVSTNLSGHNVDSSDFEAHNFYGLMRQRFLGYSERTFLRLPTGEVVTYEQMDELSARAAGWLASQGVAGGNRVLAQLPKSIETVASYLGTLRLGAVYIPLNTAYTDAEVNWFTRDAEPAVVIRDSASLSQGLAEAVPYESTAHCGPDDLAALVYTSGTTGAPKGPMLTHSNLWSNTVALARSWRFEPTVSDTLLHALPIYHVHGLMVALHTAMFSASEVLFLERFDAASVLSHLPEATVMMGVPTYYSRLPKLEGFDAQACTNVRLFTSGSAPMTAALHREVQERTGQSVLERYGMSEALMLTSNPYDGERVAGTVGFALTGVQVRVRGDRGRSVVGETGMVEVRGSGVGPGYWRRPEATAQSRTSDGWLITGDIGSVDHQGRLTLEGRLHDMIISGGINVYPVEIEQALDAHPQVSESAVVGLPHNDLGEAVTAFVVPEPGSELRRSELASTGRDLLADLARYKHPKRYVLLDELPRNAMGKVLEAELRTSNADLYTC